MNDRILELANKANEDVGFTFKMEDARKIHELMEKFAELIVRKCTNMLPADTVRNEDGVHMFYVIREHFGVPTIGR